MRIICIDPRTNQLWQQLVGQHRSDVFHSPEWMRVLSDTYNFDVRAYVFLDAAVDEHAGIHF